VSFSFRPLEFPEVVLIEPQRFKDGRGFFLESYKQSAFASYGIPSVFVQDNCSCSARGVLRGLHYQKAPAAQGKLVFAVVGEIFDVVVDIRKGSPTYGRWAGIRLSIEREACMIYVPPGFAHGFCTLSDTAIVMYKTTAEYAADLDRGILWNDPALGIDWPVTDPLLSDRDRRWPTLAEAENNFVYETTEHVPPQMRP
jgi:dTDP-4-dehydrorhamnose 3,5-epimerase